MVTQLKSSGTPRNAFMDGMTADGFAEKIRSLLDKQRIINERAGLQAKSLGGGATQVTRTSSATKTVSTKAAAGDMVTLSDGTEAKVVSVDGDNATVEITSGDNAGSQRTVPVSELTAKSLRSRSIAVGDLVTTASNDEARVIAVAGGEAEVEITAGKSMGARKMVATSTLAKKNIRYRRTKEDTEDPVFDPQTVAADAPSEDELVIETDAADPAQAAAEAIMAALPHLAELPPEEQAAQLQSIIEQVYSAGEAVEEIAEGETLPPPVPAGDPLATMSMSRDQREIQQKQTRLLDMLLEGQAVNIEALDAIRERLDQIETDADGLKSVSAKNRKAMAGSPRSVTRAPSAGSAVIDAEALKEVREKSAEINSKESKFWGAGVKSKS